RRRRHRPADSRPGESRALSPPFRRQGTHGRVRSAHCHPRGDRAWRGARRRAAVPRGVSLTNAIECRASLDPVRASPGRIGKCDRYRREFTMSKPFLDCSGEVSPVRATPAGRRAWLASEITDDDWRIPLAEPVLEEIRALARFIEAHPVQNLQRSVAEIDLPRTS